MMAKHIYLAILIGLSLIASATCDISEYFLRDPYTQRDLFRQTQQSKGRRVLSTKSQENNEDDGVKEAAKRVTKKLSEGIERRSSSPTASQDSDYYDDYYDFLYEAEQEAALKRQQEEAAKKAAVAKRRERPAPKVASDVLRHVKPPKRGQNNKRPYRYRRPNDNIAMPTYTNTRREEYVRPPKNVEATTEDEADDGDEITAGLDKVERLIPSSIKTIIEDSGKRIVKSVLEPVNDLSKDMKVNLARKGTQIKEANFASKMDHWLRPYRTYFGYMAPVFAPDHITIFLVSQWVSTFAITFVWILVGYGYNTMFTGRSNDARSHQEPWEHLVPSSDTVAMVLQDLAVSAQRWHDEL